MKKILLVAMTLLMTVSVAFGARETGADLFDIFGRNQLGIGYNLGEAGLGLYSDFGTDKLRFSVNVLELGGSMFNNTQEVGSSTESSMPVINNGLPRFFVAAGYNMGAHRFALGYGYKRAFDAQANDGTAWNGNDISVAYQGTFGANTIRFATPIQFGMGSGKTQDIGNGDDVKEGAYTPDADGKFKDYELKNLTAFAMEPTLRWLGKIGPLTQVRLYVPFSSSTVKGTVVDDADGKVKKGDEKASSVGAQLRTYFTLITRDTATFGINAFFSYNTAVEGNRLTHGVMGANLDSAEGFATGSSETAKNTKYTLEKPWAYNIKLEFPVASAGSDVVSVYATPSVSFSAVGAAKMYLTAAPDSLTAPVRKTPFYGLGYGLVIGSDFTVNKDLTLKIAAEGTGSTPFGDEDNDKYDVNSGFGASVDMGVVWFF